MTPQGRAWRRFLTDLAFFGGVLALAAGLAASSYVPTSPETPSADQHHPQDQTVMGPERV